MLSCSELQDCVMHSGFIQHRTGTLTHCSAAGFPASKVTSLRDCPSSLQSMCWVCTIPFVPELASGVNPWQTMGSAWTVAGALPVMGLTAGATQPGNPCWSGQLLCVWRVSLVSETTYGAVGCRAGS